MRYLPAAVLVALSLSLTDSSHAFLDFFKKDLDKVPETAERRAEEATAQLLVTEAAEYEASGKTDKAFDVYKSVVKKHPLTTSAAMSQYKLGAIQKGRGQYLKAFDSFQKFVDEYKQSSAFDAAIASQFEIAKASQTGEHKQRFVGISRKVQRSEVVLMYEAVIQSAPYSEYAPQAQYAIGEVLEEDDKEQLAVVAFKKVVTSYPKSKLAGEAQFRIGEILAKEVEDGSLNIANVNLSRDAFHDVIIAYEDGGRAEEARTRVAQFDELEAQKALDVGRFYEKQKNYKSAALYYRRVSQLTGTSAAEAALERLAIVESKIGAESASRAEAVEGPTTAGPVEATVGKSKKRFLSRPQLGSRLFGRKKREREAAEAEAEALVQASESPVAAEANQMAMASEPKPMPKPQATVAKKPVAKKPMPTSTTNSQIAKVSPGSTKLTKRKDYLGPPAPNLALGKKQNKMRMDTSDLQNLPFEIGKIDKGDLEKGLKILNENLPDELPDDLSKLVIPPAVKEKITGAIKPPSDAGGDGDGDGDTGLKIPPPPEDDGE